MIIYNINVSRGFTFGKCTNFQIHGINLNFENASSNPATYSLYGAFDIFSMMEILSINNSVKCIFDNVVPELISIPSKSLKCSILTFISIMIP